MKENTNDLSYRKRLRFTVPILFFASLTTCFFSGMEVYMGNYNEFTFPFSQTWWIVLVFALGVAAVASAVISLLHSRIAFILDLLAFTFGLCFYIQMMALNGEMQSFTGDNIAFDGQTKAINLLLWTVIAAAVIVICCVGLRHGALPIMRKILAFASLALVFIQSAGFVSSAASLPKSDILKQGYFSSDGEYELGSESNVVWFVIDGCDGKIVENALEEDRRIFEGFGDFTYFPDSVSCYSRTYPSIIYMLTHEQCFMDKPYEDYVSDAWKHTEFIPSIKEYGADVRLYTEPRYLGVLALDYIDNFRTYSGKTFEIINPIKLINQMLHMSLYRGMPYCLKEPLAYNVAITNSLVMKMPADTAIQFDDYNFYLDLSSKGLSVSDKYSSSLRFYHLWGTHSGRHLDADCNYKQGATETEGLQASIKIIRTYMEQMMELGIYDDSTIIITADHGYPLSSADLQLPDAITCVMMAKPPVDINERASASDLPNVSGMPVSHENIYNTVLAEFRRADQSYGNSLFYADADKTERRFWFTAFTSDIDGEVLLREYIIKGDARDFSNWKYTGNDYEILYSERGTPKNKLGK